VALAESIHYDNPFNPLVIMTITTNIISAQKPKFAKVSPSMKQKAALLSIQNGHFQAIKQRECVARFKECLKK